MACRTINKLQEEGIQATARKVVEKIPGNLRQHLHNLQLERCLKKYFAQLCQPSTIDDIRAKTLDVVASIIVPTYGRSTYLRETLNTSLSQDAVSDIYEIIIVDNKPCNNSKESIESLYRDHEVKDRD